MRQIDCLPTFFLFRRLLETCVFWCSGKNLNERQYWKFFSSDENKRYWEYDAETCFISAGVHQLQHLRKLKCATSMSHDFFCQFVRKHMTFKHFPQTFDRCVLRWRFKIIDENNWPFQAAYIEAPSLFIYEIDKTAVEKKRNALSFV